VSQKRAPVISPSGVKKGQANPLCLGDIKGGAKRGWGLLHKIPEGKKKKKPPRKSESEEGVWREKHKGNQREGVVDLMRISKN